jgi:large subunit ribosomal protein L22
MEICAKAKFIRIAPDKIRVLTNLVKGKTLTNALTQLAFSGRTAAKPLILVLKQAKDQAKDKYIQGELIIKTVQVDEGPKLKRRRIRQQGRSTAILKRGSHITIVLTDNQSQSSKIKVQNEKKDEKK